MVLGLVAHCWLSGGDPYMRRTFDSHDWRDPRSETSRHAVRVWMVDDLIESHDLHGRSRDDVIGLLGRPTTTSHLAEWDMVYWLGPERAVRRVNSEWLVFRLDRQGRVRNYRIARD